MSHHSGAAGGQSGVTSATEMNGTMTSQSRDSAERSSPPAAAAGHAASDVIKSSLARTDGQAEAEADAVTVSCSDSIIDTYSAQQNDISGAATVDTR